MKSIICIFLLLSTTLSLFPFSSTTFTSTNNPILLPTSTTDDNGVLRPEVLDMDGQPLNIGEEYRIISALAGGGTVYLENIGNTKCPNAVIEHFLQPGTPVKFFTKKLGGVVREMDDINIMFSVTTPNRCVNETVWKVDDTRFVVTGGHETISNWFKIQKVITERPNSYTLRYCPSDIDCSNVGGTSNSGYYRLALTNSPSRPYRFEKVHKTHA